MRKYIKTFIIATLYFVTTVAFARNICTGTFSNLSYNSNAGDIIGTEIRVVLTNVGYKAVVQISEGGPGPLLIVDVQCDGKKISFNILEPKQSQSERFVGLITKKGLSGQFFYLNGSEKIILRRTKSYWD